MDNQTHVSEGWARKGAFRRSFAIAAVSLAVLLAVSTLALAAEEPSPCSRWGGRVTLWGSGFLMGGILMTSGPGAALVFETSQLSVPLVEIMVPIGSWSLMAGFLYSWASESFYGRGLEDRPEQAFFRATGGTLGATRQILASGGSSVSIGGRVGLADSRVRDVTRGSAEGPETMATDGPNTCVGDLFVVTEYLFASHVGLQGEIGVSFLMRLASEERSSGVDETLSTYWFFPYTAISGVLRY